MKRYIYATSLGFIILSTTAVQTTFATSNIGFDTEIFSDVSLSLESRGDRYSSRGVSQRSIHSIDNNIIQIPSIELTDAEITEFTAMSDTDRIAYLRAKGLTRKSPLGNKDISQDERRERLTKNAIHQLEERKMKIQKKINAKERLTRLDKKFAHANALDSLHTPRR